MAHATVDRIHDALEVLLNECQLEAGQISQEIGSILDNPEQNIEWHVREPGIPLTDLEVLKTTTILGPSKVNKGKLADKFRQQEFVGELTNLFFRLRSHLELHQRNTAAGHVELGRSDLRDYQTVLRGENPSRHDR